MPYVQLLETQNTSCPYYNPGHFSTLEESLFKCSFNKHFISYSMDYLHTYIHTVPKKNVSLGMLAEEVKVYSPIKINNLLQHFVFSSYSVGIILGPGSQIPNHL